METMNTLYLMVAIFIVLGIILYFVYKALYERNLNRVLQHKKARKLPSMWVVIIIYSITVLIFSASMFGKNEEKSQLCMLENNDWMLISSDGDESLQSQLSFWIFDQNDMDLTKQNLRDNFDLLIGNSERDEFMYYVTYQLHGIDASDKIKMEVMNQDTNQLLQLREFEGDFLRSGNKLYLYVRGEYQETKTDCIRHYRVKITVEGKPELTVEKQIRLKMGSHITYQP